MKSIVFYLTILCFTSTSLMAQAAFSQTAKGKVAGKIIDKSNAEGLIGATVQVEGVPGGAITDVEGKYILALDPGNYTLVYNYISYKPQKLSITVNAGEVTFADLAMEENKTELKEVVITYTVEKSSSLSLLTERKNAAQVSDGVSAELIRKTPDRTTSDVLKRVTGASIQEGKFAVIRGMNDRYNAGYLDGALLPSTEADRKAFAFDAVPANLIDNLQIIKAGSPELSGDFGGGIIRINTKAVPENLTQNISIGGQIHDLTTSKNFLEFKSYSGENLNFLNSQRDLPSIAPNSLKSTTSFPTTDEARKFADISKTFNNDWTNETVKAPLNTRFSYSLGFPIKLSETSKLGMIVALNYSDTRRFSQAKVNSFDGSGQTAGFTDNLYLRNITDGGIFNVSYVGSKTQVNFRNLVNVNTDYNTIVRTGLADIDANLKVNNTANIVNYNRLINSIFSVKQIVGENLFTVNASVNYSNVKRKIPNYRIASYSQTPDDEHPLLAEGDFFNSSTGRFYSELNEKLYGANLEAKKQFNGNLKTELKVGYFYQNRVRDFYGRSFVYGGSLPGEPTYNPATDLAANNIGASKLYLVEKTSDDISYYNGKSNQNAFYVSAGQKFFEKLKAVYGVRYEKVDIVVDNQKTNQSFAHINEGAFLPSANLTYTLTDKTNLRADYFASVNRPEFRELAPFSFYAFDKNAEIKGNKDLKIANLNNFDLRYEFYPSGSQVLSAGAFYKSILNPVEFSLDVTQPTTTFTYQNEKSAKVYGLEFEVRKNFDFFGEAQVLKDLSVFSNLALVHSSLTFEAGSQAKQNRPLQGQSPYVFNAGLQYESAENGWSVSFVANQVGRRIAFAGVDPKFGNTRQDIYEAPRMVLDFQLAKTIKRFNIKLTLGDLLRHEQIFYQDVDNNGKYAANGSDRLMFSYTQGRTIALSLGYTF
jgi:TonB-dependent receptor